MAQAEKAGDRRASERRYFPCRDRTVRLSVRPASLPALYALERPIKTRRFWQRRTDRCHGDNQLRYHSIAWQRFLCNCLVCELELCSYWFSYQYRSHRRSRLSLLFVTRRRPPALVGVPISLWLDVLG